MIYLITAVILIFISNAAALLVIAGIDVTQYVDIMAMCRMLDETAAQCTSVAIHAGLVGCLAAVILLALLILTNRRFPASLNAMQVGGEVFVAFAPLIIVVVGFELWIELTTPWPIYQYEFYHSEIFGGSAALSLGNFIWPLCLQFANNARAAKWRILFLSLVAPIVAESPFRGVILALAIFGIAAPTVEGAVAQIRLRRFDLRLVAIYSSILLVGLAALAAELVIETQNRPTNLKMAGGTAFQLAEKLGQRIAIPLYQAHLALAYSIDQQVPSIEDEVLTKLRLRNATGLNGFFYQMLHPSVVPGETTSLYFGEATVRTVAPPIIWCVVAPFILVLVWVALRRYRYATGTLIGIAMWRGSLGGFVAIAPTLAIQLVLFMALTFLFRRENSYGC